MRLPVPILHVFGADPSRPDLDAPQTPHTFAAWRARGAPGTGSGADVDGSYEPGRPGGPKGGTGRTGWAGWLGERC